MIWRDRSGSISHFPQGLISEGVQSAISHILLKLPIPNRGVKLREPCAKRRQILVWKLPDGLGDIVDSAHTAIVTRANNRSNRPLAATAKPSSDSSSRAFQQRVASHLPVRFLPPLLKIE